jgi:hypothetical protein
MYDTSMFLREMVHSNQRKSIRLIIIHECECLRIPPLTFFDPKFLLKQQASFCLVYEKKVLARSGVPGLKNGDKD